MYDNRQDVIEWYKRNGRTGWRLMEGKNIINESFSISNTPESSLESLSTELVYLKGGTYDVIAKDRHDEARKIFLCRFVLAHGAAAIQAPASVAGLMPGSFTSMAGFNAELDRRMEMYELKRRNADLEDAVNELSAIKTKKPDLLSGLLENPAVQEKIGMVIGHLMNKVMPIAPPIRVSGGGRQIAPPVQNQMPPQAPVEENDDQDDLSLTPDQADMLSEAFFDTVEQIGTVDDTLVLLECLPRYIEANRETFEHMIKPQLLQYKIKENE